MDLKNFRFDVDGDGIATATWDMAGKSMNVIDLSVMDEIEKIVGEISANEAIKGAIITSGKEAFSGGADLNMLEALNEAFQTELARNRESAVKKLFEDASRLGNIYRRLETCGKPVVAALNGTAVGGAFELALACHHRIVADDDRIKLGLPEVKVGLMPGAGGTQRVARLANPQDALAMLLKGDQLSPSKAKAMKLVDQVVPAAELLPAAKKWLKESPRQGRAVGRGRLQAAGRQGLFGAGRQRLPAGGRDLPARDLRQLSRRRAASSRRCSRGCSCPSTRRSGSRRAISRTSCRARKRRR